MYSFTRVVIGPKLARMLMVVSSVVRTTRTSEMPSTPTLYSMPKKPDPADLLDELEAHGRWVEREHEHDARGRTATARDRERRPADGRQPIRRDEGEHERADEWREDDQREDVELADVDHQRASQMKRSAIAMRPSGDAQRVVLDPAGLDAACAVAERLGARGDAVDDAVDDAHVEPHDAARDGPAEAARRPGR